MLIFKFYPVAALLLVHSLQWMSCQAVYKSSEGRIDELISLPKKDVRNGIIRYHKLYHNCTGHHVRITPVKRKRRRKKSKNKCGRFKAIGKSDDSYITLVFESKTIKGLSGITIREKRTNNYLCFNNKGKPIAMCSGDRLRCLFEEDIQDDFSIFRLVRNKKKWYLGFSTRGKPLPSRKFRRKRFRKCFRFMKRDNDFSSNRSSGPNLGNNTNLFHTLANETLSRKLWSKTRRNQRWYSG
ncbi:fibroblast growth factor 18-like [Limulus polyphemus]|uniref:Fibroblast growth factor 18-like n=1 Tax=Limulus polyphemus TaxID=6850 RepID=A0ABM1STY0_LIMPO|nr:fibroblast growth factor 18-like [Limulus polyphemus]